MKRVVYMGVAIAILTAAQTPVARANGDLDRILANMQRAAQSVKTIQANLHHEKRLVQIGGKETNSGLLLFRHTGKNLDKVRIEYRNTGQVIVVDGERIVLYQPRINQVVKTCRKAVAGSDQDFYFIKTPYSSIQELKSRFNISYIGDAMVGSAATAAIEMIPKTASNSKKITMWVDRSSWLPIKYQVVEQNGNVSTFTLADMVQNPKIGGDAFKVTWPSGTKVMAERGC